MIALFLLVSLSIILLFLLYYWIFGLSGLHKDSTFNQKHGRYRVRFFDGAISEVMCRDKAKSVANFSDGKVIRAKRRNKNV